MEFEWDNQKNEINRQMNERGGCIATAIKTYHIDPDQKLTVEQKKELEEVAKRPIVYDEDSPELSKEELAQF
jgi:uncharacterized DUF497 family protein